jgi:pyruvate kinase
VQAMDRIIREAERIPSQSPPVATRAESDTQAVCEAAAVLAIDMKAAALTALTRSGRTAQTLSSLRPRVPIFAFLWEDERLARRLNLWHGVVPHVVHGELNGADVTERIEQELTSREMLQEGACVIVVGAAPGGPAGRTNLIRVLRL